jgi:protein-tyrosine-phosphatase
MLNVVFICTGNMCRSPVAEGILKSRWKTIGRGELRVTSMGISGIEDRPASDFSQQLCEENGIDIESHRSRALKPDELMDADVIFVMEPMQQKHLRLLFPSFRDKIVMLGAWPGKQTRKSKIKDPIGRSLKVYRAVYKSIDTHLDRVMPSLLGLAGY